MISLGAVDTEIANKADDNLDAYASEKSAYRDMVPAIQMVPRLVDEAKCPAKVVCLQIMHGEGLIPELVTTTSAVHVTASSLSPLTSTSAVHVTVSFVSP